MRRTLLSLAVCTFELGNGQDVALDCAVSFAQFLEDLSALVDEGRVLDIVEVRCNQGNRIDGPVPPELAQLSNLRILDLVNNGDLEGEIPDFVYDLVELEELRLTNTPLTGPISADLENLSNLRQLDIADCDFTGSLPDVFQDFPEDGLLRVGGNNFVGVMPQHDVINTDTPAGTILGGEVPPPIPDPTEQPEDDENPDPNQDEQTVNDEEGGEDDPIGIILGVVGALAFAGVLMAFVVTRHKQVDQEPPPLSIHRIESSNMSSRTRLGVQSNQGNEQSERILTMLTIPAQAPAMPGQSMEFKKEHSSRRKKKGSRSKRKIRDTGVTL